MKAVKDMTTAELVAEYNDLTGKSIKKFSSRKAGEGQVERARAEGKKVEFTLAEAKAAEAAEMEGEVATDEVAATDKPVYNGLVCPGCGSTEESGNITYAGAEGTAAGERFFCHHCGTEFHGNGKKYRAPKASEGRSASVSATWTDEAVRAARRERTGVNVYKPGEKTPLEFRSVGEAFKKLGLPMGRHIAFRMKLKAAPKCDLSFEHGGVSYRFIGVSDSQE